MVNRRYITLMGLLILVTAFFSSRAQAYTCTTSDGGIIPPFGSPTPIDVRVRVGPILAKGKNEIVNISQVSCKSDVYQIIDYLSTDNNALELNPVFFTNIRAGLTINGADYDYPVQQGIAVHTVTHLNSTQTPIRMFIYVQDHPTKDISIKKGDIISTVNFVQRNDQRGNTPMPYRWRLIADNDAYFQTTSCTINNGQQMNVNFGPIRQDKLTETVASANIKQDRSLTYHCDDNTASQDILVRLVSSPSGFSSDYIGTTNPDVGVALIHNGSVIKPNQTFRGSIVNGNGSDNISFIPIKSSTHSKNIATGQLSGSATLIFSAP